MISLKIRVFVLPGLANVPGTVSETVPTSAGTRMQVMQPSHLTEYAAFSSDTGTEWSLYPTSSASQRKD
jgi:hypothetical protein